MSAPAPFTLTTPAQLRRFRLLTLAQMVYLESVGLSMTTTTAKKQAIEYLDLNEANGAGYVTAAELIEGLRYLAQQSKGLDVEAPTPRRPAPKKADRMEATL